MTETLASWIGAIVAIMGIVLGTTRWFYSQILETRRDIDTRLMDVQEAMKSGDEAIKGEINRLRELAAETNDKRETRLRAEITALDVRWRDEHRRLEDSLRLDLRGTYQEPPRGSRVRQA